MADKSALYQAVIIDHNRNPRNFREMEHPTLSAQGHNPLCGDQITVHLRIEGDRIADATFTGNGCAISKAAASVMTTAIRDKTRTEVEALHAAFEQLVHAAPDTPLPADDLGDLAAFVAVRAYPVRVKCATLAWHTMMAALVGKEGAVSTE